MPDPKDPTSYFDRILTFLANGKLTDEQEIGRQQEATAAGQPRPGKMTLSSDTPAGSFNEFDEFSGSVSTDQRNAAAAALRQWLGGPSASGSREYPRETIAVGETNPDISIALREILRQYPEAMQKVNATVTAPELQRPSVLGTWSNPLGVMGLATTRKKGFPEQGRRPTTFSDLMGTIRHELGHATQGEALRDKARGSEYPLSLDNMPTMQQGGPDMLNYWSDIINSDIHLPPEPKKGQ